MQYGCIGKMTGLTAGQMEEQGKGETVVLADALVPRGWRTAPVQQAASNAALIIAASLLTAVAAQVSIRLPFTPVPITGQTFAVLLAGAALGMRRGAASQMLYLLEGLAGLPVFAEGKAGLAALLGPTGGYLVGFVVAAAATGWLAERGWDRRATTTALAMVLGNLIIYLFGMSWLAVFTGPAKALALGVLPFLPGDACKVALATVVLPGVWHILARTSLQQEP